MRPMIFAAILALVPAVAVGQTASRFCGPGQPGFTASGTWSPIVEPRAVGGMLSITDDPAATAGYRFDNLPDGPCMVYATWVGGPNRVEAPRLTVRQAGWKPGEGSLIIFARQRDFNLGGVVYPSLTWGTPDPTGRKWLFMGMLNPRAGSLEVILDRPNAEPGLTMEAPTVQLAPQWSRPGS